MHESQCYSGLKSDVAILKAFEIFLVISLSVIGIQRKLRIKSSTKHWRSQYILFATIVVLS